MKEEIVDKMKNIKSYIDSDKSDLEYLVKKRVQFAEMSVLKKEQGDTKSGKLYDDSSLLLIPIKIDLEERIDSLSKVYQDLEFELKKY